MTGPILVIGGGPAGSTVSTLLAQRGYDVRLFEKTTFPREHIGESLLPATLATLELTGALDAVESAGFVEKAGATMLWGKDSTPWTWYFRETNTRFPHSYQVNRPEFDEILLNHAIESGVGVQQDALVSKVEFEGDRATGVVVNNKLVEGEFVVDASGQSSLLSNQLKLKKWDAEFRNLAAFGYFYGGQHLEGEDRGNILVESVQDGWIWKIPLKHHVSSVGVVVDQGESLQSIRQLGVQTYYQEVLSRSSLTKDLLQESRFDNKIALTRDWSYDSEQFAGSNWVLVGDAACFIDPLFSTGVHLAISGAFIAAAYVTTALEEQTLEQRAADSYDRLYRQQYKHFRELTRLFYSGNRTVNSYFWETRRLTDQKRYSPRDAFVRAVSGQNVAGYERSVLSHASTPSTFNEALGDIENNRQRIITRLQTLKLSEFRLIKDVDVTIADDLILGKDRFAHGLVVKSPGRDPLPVSSLVASVIQRCKQPISYPDLLNHVIHDSPTDSERLSNDVARAVNLLLSDEILHVVD